MSITYFEPDVHKAGGQYTEITDRVKRVDTGNRVVELTSMDGFLNKTVKIGVIMDIEIHSE